MFNESKFIKLKFPTVNTGNGTIPILTLIAIWSISMITSLPGLAVTPILGDLDKIFPHISDLEIQMLSSLPNLLIIPFILLSGQLSNNKSKLTLLILGLAIFLLCGILYFFANSMNALIMISCFLGIGAGLIIPLSTGLIADFFIGQYRTRQMGLSSGINNLTLVLATLLTGSLAKYNWHLPFIVYLIPSVSLILCYFLSSKYIEKFKKERNIAINKIKSKNKNENPNTKNSVENTISNTPLGTKVLISSNTLDSLIPAKKNINKKLLIGLIFLYFLITTITILVIFNISFILQDYKLSSTLSGTIISLYCLGVMIPGFCVVSIVKILKNHIVYLCFLSVMIGFLFLIFFKSVILIAVGAIIMGLGYGTLQPLIYDKTSLVTNSKKITFALACVMSGNYLAIIVCPFMANFFQIIFHKQHDMIFPFWVNMIIAAILTIIAFIRKDHFLFSAESSMYHEDEQRKKLN